MKRACLPLPASNLRIGELGPMHEVEIDASGEDGERDDDLRRPFTRSPSNGERVVVVVDQLDRRGQTLARAVRAERTSRAIAGSNLAMKPASCLALLTGSSHTPSRAPVRLPRISNVLQMVSRVLAFIGEHLCHRSPLQSGSWSVKQPHVPLQAVGSRANDLRDVRADLFEQLQRRLDRSSIVAKPSHPAGVGCNPRPIEATARPSKRGQHDVRRYQIGLD